MSRNGLGDWGDCSGFRGADRVGGSKTFDGVGIWEQRRFASRMPTHHVRQRRDEWGTQGGGDSKGLGLVAFALRATGWDLGAKAVRFAKAHPSHETTAR